MRGVRTVDGWEIIVAETDIEDVNKRVEELENIGFIVKKVENIGDGTKIYVLAPKRGWKR